MHHIGAAGHHATVTHVARDKHHVRRLAGLRANRQVRRQTEHDPVQPGFARLQDVGRVIDLQSLLHERCAKRRVD
jgi:hypothetical protein